MSNKGKFSIQEIFYILVSGLFIVYSLLEILGGVSWIKEEDQVQIIFSLVCLLFIYLVLERPSINYIKKLLTSDKVQIMEVLLNDLDIELRDIFEENLNKNLEFYKNAIQHKTINIEKGEEFSKYYKISLKRFPNALVLATSLPSKTYFWKNDFKANTVEKAIADFVKNGGINSRIFFIDHENDIELPEIKEILDFQKDVMNVKVATVLINEVPEKFRDHFFVAFDRAESQFAWLARVNHKGEVCDYQFTVNDNKINEYKKVYNNLRKAPSYAEY